MTTLSMSRTPSLCSVHSPHSQHRSAGSSTSPSPSCSPSVRRSRTPGGSLKARSSRAGLTHGPEPGLSPSAPNLFLQHATASPSALASPSKAGGPSTLAALTPSRASPAMSSSKKRQSSTSADKGSWESSRTQLCLDPAIWTRRRGRTTEHGRMDSSGTEESESEEVGNVSAELSPDQEIGGSARPSALATEQAANVGLAMNAALGQTPAPSHRRLHRLGQIHDGQLEQRFATHVSMTPPARFGSNALIDESPFVSSASQLPAPPATDMRYGGHGRSLSAIPRSQAFGPLVPGPLPASSRSRGALAAAEMGRTRSHESAATRPVGHGLRRTWALHSELGEAAPRMRRPSTDSTGSDGSGSVAHRRGRNGPAPLTLVASNAGSAAMDAAMKQPHPSSSEDRMDLDDDDVAPPCSPSPGAEVLFPSRHFDEDEVSTSGDEGEEAMLRPGFRPAPTARRHGNSSSHLSDASVFGSDEAIPPSNSASTVSSTGTAVASRSSPYETPYKRRATGSERVRAASSGSHTPSRHQLGSASGSHSEGRLAANLFGFGSSGAPTMTSARRSEEGPIYQAKRRSTGSVQDDLQAGEDAAPAPVSSTPSAPRRLSFVASKALPVPSSGSSAAGDSPISQFFGSRNSSVSTNEGSGDFDDSGVAFGTPGSSLKKGAPVMLVGPLSKQLGMTANNSSLSRSPAAAAAHRAQAREAGGASHPFTVRERSRLAQETTFSDGGSSAASSPRITHRNSRVASFPEGLDSPARVIPPTASGSHLDVGSKNELPSSVFMTPQNYKNVKPLATAFMSTGLMSKQQRNRTPSGALDVSSIGTGAGAESPLPKLNFGAAPNAQAPASHLALREVVAAGNAQAAAHAASGANHTMPDTPVKKPTATSMEAPSMAAKAPSSVLRPPPSVLRPPPHSVLGARLRTAPSSSELGADASDPSGCEDSPLLGESCESPTLSLTFLNGGRDVQLGENIGSGQFRRQSHNDDVLAHLKRPRSPLMSAHPLGQAASDARRASFARMGSITSRFAESASEAKEAGVAARERPGSMVEGTSSQGSNGGGVLGMRPNMLRSKTLSRATLGLQRKSSVGLGDIPWAQATTAMTGPGSARNSLNLASPVLGTGPIPSTPTRSAAQIKWFEAAQLVTTPSPGSRSKRASVGSRTNKGSRLSQGATPARKAAIKNWDRPAAPVVGHFEAHFTVLSVLGRGEFSEAVKVEEKSTRCVYAVKRMKRAFQGPRDRVRCLEEVDILRELSGGATGGHPNVISMVNAWEEAGHLHIQTELCPLGTLDFFLETYANLVGKVEEPRLWKILAELTAGLDHIHRHDILHLDLKPANVFITEIGTLKIGDFGLASRWPPVSARQIIENAAVDGITATLADSAAPVARKSRGSRGVNLEREGDREYIAPEVIFEGRYSKAADMFSLGLIMLEAAAGVVLPDNGEPWQKLRCDDFSDADLSGFSVSLVRLIHSLLNSKPSARPTVEGILAHPVVRAVQARMAQGLMAEELDQLPEFDLPSGDSGLSLPSANGDADDAVTPEEESHHPTACSADMERSSSNGSALGLTGLPASQSADEQRVLDVRGALIQEPDDDFLADVLGADPDPQGREMWTGEDEGHVEAWSPVLSDKDANVGLGIESPSSGSSSDSPFAAHFVATPLRWNASAAARNHQRNSSTLSPLRPFNGGNRPRSRLGSSQDSMDLDDEEDADDVF